MSKQLHFKTTIVFLNLQRNRSHAERNSKVAPPEELDHLDCQFRQYFRGNRKMALPICQLFRKRFLLFFLTVYLFYSFSYCVLSSSFPICFPWLNIIIFFSILSFWTLSSFASSFFLLQLHYRLPPLLYAFCTRNGFNLYNLFPLTLVVSLQIIIIIIISINISISMKF